MEQIANNAKRSWRVELSFLNVIGVGSGFRIKTDLKGIREGDDRRFTDLGEDGDNLPCQLAGAGGKRVGFYS